jgi:hypothetical protein
MSPKTSGWQRLLRTGHISWSWRQIRDVLPRRLGSGRLEVSAPEQGVCRGREVEASITVSKPEGLDSVEVGLVCTESYDYRDSGYGADDAPSRGTSYAIAYEAWRPVVSAPGRQVVGLAIPPQAPFSFDGDCLSFKWEVMVRGRRRRRLDALAGHEILVLP